MTRLYCAIPGEPAERIPLPAGVVEQAIAAIGALALELSNARVWGFLEPPPLRAWHDPMTDQLLVSVGPAMTRTRAWSHHIHWQWSVRAEKLDGGHRDIGWHPVSSNFLALEDQWKTRLRQALEQRSDA